MTWSSDDIPPSHGITPMGWMRIVLRGLAVGTVTFGCLLLLLLVRLVERPVFGQGRPVTPYITQFVCRSAFVFMGITYTKVGT
ncbi:MAG: 1-acyl-sn-glycerol-3-phosphate acyltransferase, partial [Octadecabacter sp.]